MARPSVRKATASTQAAAAASPTPEDASAAHDMRCEYPSKFCSNPKANKHKGGVHKFCELHRRKANQNQKRWQQRRRDQRDMLRKQNTARMQAESMKASPTAAAAATRAEAACEPADATLYDPFPIVDFSGASQVVHVTHLHAPPVQFPPRYIGLPQYNNAVCTPEEDLDALTVMMYNDSVMAPEYPPYNWPAMKIDASLELASGYTITGNCAAIV